MKIKSVEATWLHVPIPEARQYACDLDGRAGPQDASPAV